MSPAQPLFLGCEALGVVPDFFRQLYVIHARIVEGSK